jgi:DNA-binding transcriptional ArsR family regulator
VVTYGSTAEAVFDALGDPTRRSIVEQLRAGGPMPVGALAATLPVSRPAVSQHLKVLKGAGLVTDRSEGTRRLYAVDPQGFDVARAYLQELWSDALGSFKAFVEGDAR